MVRLVAAAAWVVMLLLVLVLLPLPGAAAAAASTSSTSTSSSQYADEVGLGARPAPGKVAYGIMVYQRANKTVGEVQTQFEVRLLKRFLTDQLDQIDRPRLLAVCRRRAAS